MNRRCRVLSRKRTMIAVNLMLAVEAQHHPMTRAGTVGQSRSTQKLRSRRGRALQSRNIAVLRRNHRSAEQRRIRVDPIPTTTSCHSHYRPRRQNLLRGLRPVHLCDLCRRICTGTEISMKYLCAHQLISSSSYQRKFSYRMRKPRRIWMKTTSSMLKSKRFCSHVCQLIVLLLPFHIYSISEYVSVILYL